MYWCFNWCLLLLFSLQHLLTICCYSVSDLNLFDNMFLFCFRLQPLWQSVSTTRPRQPDGTLPAWTGQDSRGHRSIPKSPPEAGVRRVSTTRTWFDWQWSILSSIKDKWSVLFYMYHYLACDMYWLYKRHFLFHLLKLIY